MIVGQIAFEKDKARSVTPCGERDYPYQIALFLDEVVGYLFLILCHYSLVVSFLLGLRP